MLAIGGRRFNSLINLKNYDMGANYLLSTYESVTNQPHGRPPCLPVWFNAPDGRRSGQRPDAAG